jgi:hypothetical protein
MPWLPGCGQSPTVSESPTLSPSFFHGWLPGTYASRLSGMMSALSAEKHCPRSTLSQAASPARISVLQALELAWTESEAGLYLKSSGSLANADHDSSSWRTSQLSLFGGLTAFSWDSMRWGMMRAGQLYQPQRWEPRTFESESGYWPTPNARDWKDTGGSQGNRKSPNLGTKVGGPLNPTWVEWLMRYPAGWTVLSASVTAWFRSQRAKRSKDSEGCDV